MNNLIKIFSIIVILTILSSCNYVKKNKEKIVGVWTAETVIDGVEATEYYQFNDNGTFECVCTIDNPEIPGYTVNGTWEIGSLRSKVKLNYDLSTLKFFNPIFENLDTEKGLSILKSASRNIREVSDKDPIPFEFSDFGKVMTLDFPGQGIKKFSKEEEANIKDLMLSKLQKKQKTEETEEQPQRRPQLDTPATRSILKDGLNILDGQFRFQGSDYGFIVRFMYDSATGEAYNPTYEAAGYGTESNLSDITVANDEKTLTLSGTASGTKTTIVVDYVGDSRYEGRMVRGSNNGTCILTLH